MKALKFHTNLSNECCVIYLAHYFSNTQIKNWNVNLNHPLKVLTVENDKGSACHLGCGTPEGKELPSSIGSCSVCGKPQGEASDCQQQVLSSAATPADRIHQIDEFIVRSVSEDASSHARLLADPTGFFVQASQTLFGVLPQEEFGIQEVKVVSDTDTLLYIVLPANHRPASSKTVYNQNASNYYK